MRSIVFAFLALTLALPAQAASLDRAPLRIEVPGANNLQFLTLWVALGAGYFQAEGLEPKILVAPSPRETGNRLFTGDADVALLPPPMFLGMMAEDKPVLLFASLLSNEPINLILRKDVAEARKLSAQSSLRERLMAIKGSKVGLAGEVAPRLRALYAFAGMDADKDVQQIVIPGPSQVKAFAEAKVDVLFAHTPYLETAMVDYGAVLVADTSAGEIPALTGGQVHALATTRAEVKAKPERIAAVTRAIARAERLIHADATAAVNAILASGAALGDRKHVEAIVAVYAPAVPATPQLSLEGIERDAKLYPAHPRAPDFTKTKVADYIAAQFAAQTP